MKTIARFRSIRINCLPLLAAALIAVGQDAGAAEWGSVKGKFVYAGAANNAPLTITKDIEFCGQHKPVDETIKIGEAGELQNVFIYLSLARGKTVEIHPDHKPGKDPVVLNNQGCRFEPHALAFWTANTLEIRNSDPLGHNTNAQQLVANPKFNVQIANDRPYSPKLTKPEPRPAAVACSVHPWMSAYLLIRDNPYMAVSAEDGTFEIMNLPAGKQTFAIWHESKGYVRDLAVGGDETDRRGEFTVDVPAGETLDLGLIKVTTDLLGQ